MAYQAKEEEKSWTNIVTTGHETVRAKAVAKAGEAVIGKGGGDNFSTVAHKKICCLLV